ncbi:hypothetical protein BJ875DRAFT_383602 [Amylocarpus encephaloides]|uniref:AMP-dependent synthetase/ligase domain-containing protein n=1 Tax=Amylocarpus encephaloides TaxID=45428 RepID=A0A9P8C3N6_9HELO|nr:hypothetical protein BJ875DRAFT_383602 [Amylocarpus encephaloides]
MATPIFSSGLKTPPVAHPAHRTKQLLPNIVDGMAHTRPQMLYGELPVSLTSYDQGYRTITYGAFANAINGIAWWLTKELGPGKNFPAICFMGLNDVRYIVMVLGAVKAGYKLFLNSTKNSAASNLKLFDDLSCTVLVTTAPEPPAMSKVINKEELRILIVPSVHELLTSPVEHFPYPRTFEEAAQDPLVVLHTSGTTGPPKPIIYTHDFAAACMQMMQLEPPEGFENVSRDYQGMRSFLLLPPFHASSMLAPLMEAIATQTTVIWPLATAVPSAASAVEALRHNTADAAGFPPPIVIEAANHPETLDFLSRNLKLLCYSGGDTPQACGDVITEHFRFFNVFGATEMSVYPLLRPQGEWQKDDWKYIHPHPLAGLEFREYIDGLYEAVVVRNAAADDEQPVFKLFPGLQEYHTQDLFSPHPEKAGLWKFGGRTEEIITLQSGRVNSTVMGHAVRAHPQVKEGLMVPAGRHAGIGSATKTGLLLELEQNSPLPPVERETLIREICALVEKADLEYEVEARVTRDGILLVDNGRPLPRNAKGMVQRNMAVELYATELEML